MGVSRVLLGGPAKGPALVLDEALSMWGGLDPASGRIIDRRHPQLGSVVTGTILVLPWGRGSSSTASVLAEAIRLRTSPRAILMLEPDYVILLGALAAEELYGTTCPVVVVQQDVYDSISTGDEITLEGDGSLSIR